MNDYNGLYQECVMTSDPAEIAELELICRTALKNSEIYLAVQKGTGVPWPIIAALHFRESGQDFTKHLHNGDPLTERTVHVPKGRPLDGEPPFTWQASAIDALKGRFHTTQWPIPICLYFLEAWNGFGYEKHNVLSPYLWDYTDKYTSGLFTSDGKFDPEKKETRPGCVSILKTLERLGVSLDFSRLASPKS